jgi:hypothetical protein
MLGRVGADPCVYPIRKEDKNMTYPTQHLDNFCSWLWSLYSGLKIQNEPKVVIPAKTEIQNFVFAKQTHFEQTNPIYCVAQSPSAVIQIYKTKPIIGIFNQKSNNVQKTNPIQTQNLSHRIKEKTDAKQTHLSCKSR